MLHYNKMYGQLFFHLISIHFQPLPFERFFEKFQFSFDFNLDLHFICILESANDGCFSSAYKFPSSVIIPKVSTNFFLFYFPSKMQSLYTSINLLNQFEQSICI